MLSFYIRDLKDDSDRYWIVHSNLKTIKLGAGADDHLRLSGAGLSAGMVEIYYSIDKISVRSKPSQSSSEHSVYLWNKTVPFAEVSNETDWSERHGLQVSRYRLGQISSLNDGQRFVQPTVADLQTLELDQFGNFGPTQRRRPAIPRRSLSSPRAWAFLTVLAVLLVLLGILLGSVLTGAANAEPRPLPTGTPFSAGWSAPWQATAAYPSVPTYTPTAASIAHVPSAQHTAVVGDRKDYMPVLVPTPTPTQAQPVAEIDRIQVGSAPVLNTPSTTNAEPVDSTAHTGVTLAPDLIALGMNTTRAQVNTGEMYWKLVEVRWLDVAEAQGRHAIYVDVLDEQGSKIMGQPVVISWPGEEVVGYTESKPAGEFSYNFPMYARAPAYDIHISGLPSDGLTGAGLGTPAEPTRAGLTSIQLTFRRTTAE